MRYGYPILIGEDDYPLKQTLHKTSRIKRYIRIFLITLYPMIILDLNLYEQLRLFFY